MKYALTIDEVAPSQNVVMRLHWTKQKALRDRWYWLVCQQKLAVGYPETPFDKAKVSIVRYGFKPLDPDNLVGSQKVVVDGLKRNGYIMDDSAQHITLSVIDGERPKGVAPTTWIGIEG